MRVVVAPDAFATLPATAAAAAMARGWGGDAPDEIVTVPMSDARCGLLDVLQHALGGELLAVSTCGPLGDAVPGAVLVLEEPAGRTVVVDAYQAIDLDLVAEAERDAEQAGSYGLGLLVAAAADLAAGGRVVVGLGGGVARDRPDGGVGDGGAGLLAGLGARSEPAGALTGGPRALARVTSVDLAPARRRLAGARLEVLTDHEQPLLGLRGTTNVYGVARALARERLVVVDGWLSGWAHALDPDLAGRAGAGAGGGVGYAALLVGGRLRPATGTVAELVGLPGAVGRADLVVTGERRLDVASLRGSVVSAVAALARTHGRPCVALAEVVDLGSRELRAYGIDAAYAVPSGAQGPEDGLAVLAERVARTWSGRP